MCYFLAVAVPARDAEHLDRIFGSTPFQVRPTDNRDLLAALPPAFAARLITTGGCSCDLYSPPDRSRDANPAEQLRRKYAKRGWSKSKIDRAVEQAIANGPATPMHGKTPLSPGLRGDVVERLRELCDSAAGVVVTVHWYGGDVATERMSLTPAQACTPAQLAERAATMREDELLSIATRSCSLKTSSRS